MAELRNISIPIGDYEIAAHLLNPPQQNPGILFVHGWGGSQLRDLERAKTLAALGCNCLTFDMRGHQATRQINDRVTREDSLCDVLAAYDFLASQEGIDPDAIAVVGSSYGGYLAAILTSIRRVRWLALRVPALYPDDHWDKPKQQLVREDMIRYRMSPVDYSANRALQACAEFSGDVLLVASERDDFIPHQTVLNYRDACRNASSMTYRLILDADHALSDNVSKMAYTKLLLDWIKEMVISARGGEA